MAMPLAAPMIVTPAVEAESTTVQSAAALVNVEAAPASVPAASGFYLQLGAYARADNAEAVRARLDASGALQGLSVVQAGAVHRLFSGPFASRQEAAMAGAALPSSLGLKPIIVQR